MKIDPAALAAAFVNFEWNSFPARPRGFTCDKMVRAWRNRSPVTASGWHRLALALTGNSMNAGPLYAACADFCDTPGTFNAADLTLVQWDQLSKCLVGFLHNPPEAGMSRGQYEAHRREISSKDEICHKLYECLLIWRTGRAGETANIWKITKEAEAAYRRVCRPKEIPPE